MKFPLARVLPVVFALLLPTTVLAQAPADTAQGSTATAHDGHKGGPKGHPKPAKKPKPKSKAKRAKTPKAKAGKKAAAKG